MIRASLREVCFDLMLLLLRTFYLNLLDSKFVALTSYLSAITTDGQTGIK